MSSTYIPAALRRFVIARAEGLCEYCLLHEDDTLYGHEVDHVISEKHGGPTREDNLAYACFSCNRGKGSDIASVTPEEGALVRFYHPRQDQWSEHFHLEADGFTLSPLTEVGEATIRIFGFNDTDRLVERQALQVTESYPTAAGWRRVRGETSQ